MHSEVCYKVVMQMSVSKHSDSLTEMVIKVSD